MSTTLLAAEWLSTDQIRSIVEIAIFAGAIYVLLRLVRSTRGGGIVRGLVILAGFLALGLLLLINLTKLPHLEFVFKSIVNTVILALVILFHPELRRGMARLGDHPLINRLAKPGGSRTLENLSKALENLSKQRVGALIAIERDTPLEAYIGDEGVKIDAKVSPYLLESIFHPGSALHDGGIILREERVLAAKCIFPLTDNPEFPKRFGTRHRAAMGLTEVSDATTIVVSEETGEISVCVRGQMVRNVNPSEIDKAAMELLNKPKEAAVSTTA